MGLVASPIDDQGVEFAWPLTFAKTDNEIFSTVILLLLLIQEGWLSVSSENMCIELIT